MPAGYRLVYRHGSTHHNARIVHTVIHRTDGKAGRYVQDDRRRALTLAQRLTPERVFTSGPIVIGTKNPFSVLNPEEVCWIEVDSAAGLACPLPPHIDQVRLLAGREEYEAILTRQWSLWRRQPVQGAPAFVEALVELSLRNGQSLYLHVLGRESTLGLAECVFGPHAITADLDPEAKAFINPRCIVRARVYHSRHDVTYPDGIWVAESEDI